MRARNRLVDGLSGVCLILALGGGIYGFGSGCARASEVPDSKDAGVGGGPAAAERGNRDDAAADGVSQATDEHVPLALSPKSRLSYALGMVLGNQFRAQEVEIDLGLYVRGLRDALAGGKTLLSETEARAALSVLQGDLRRRGLQASSQAASADLTAIRVSFKLDHRLTRGMYMGDRWVSPPNFMSVRQGSTATVDVRAQGVDAAGKSLKISPEWRPSDPEMVTVTPSRGNQVKITVLREGQSTLTVVSPGISIVLLVKATYQGDATRVEISR